MDENIELGGLNNMYTEKEPLRSRNGKITTDMKYLK